MLVGAFIVVAADAARAPAPTTVAVLVLVVVVVVATAVAVAVMVLVVLVVVVASVMHVSLRRARTASRMLSDPHPWCVFMRFRVQACTHRGDANLLGEKARR